MHTISEALGSLNDIARGGEGWDVPRLGTEFINMTCRVDRLLAQDLEENERQRENRRRRNQRRR